MGKILIFLIAFFLVAEIIINSGVKKLPYFFAGILFFPLTINIWQHPPISIPRLVIYALLGTALFSKQNNNNVLKSYPFKTATGFLFIMLVCVSFFAPNGSDYSFFIMLDLFIKNFILLFLTFFYVRSMEDVFYIYNILLLFLFCFCIYGIWNFVTRQTEYYDFLSSTFYGKNIPRFYLSYTSRTRISSFAWHPIYYGLVLGIGLLLNVFLIIESKKSYIKNFYTVMLFLLILNLLLSNSRTPLLAFILGFTIVFVFCLNWKYKLRIIITNLIIFLSLIFFLPKSLNILAESFNTFSSQGSELNETGSSMEMRVRQLNASLNQFYKSPLVGNGFGYVGKRLQRSAGSDYDDFEGFESYLYKLLIEQGICGMVGNAVFFFSLFKFFYNSSRRKFNYKIAITSIAMLVTFLVFIFGTGDMGSFILFMSLLGINIKYIMLSEDNNLLSSEPATQEQPPNMNSIEI